MTTLDAPDRRVADALSRSADVIIKRRSVRARLVLPVLVFGVVLLAASIATGVFPSDENAARLYLQAILLDFLLPLMTAILGYYFGVDKGFRKARLTYGAKEEDALLVSDLYEELLKARKQELAFRQQQIDAMRSLHQETLVQH